MLPVVSRLFAVLCAVFTLALAGFAEHKDERLGFQILTPSKWNAVPMKADERWMVASYVADKANFWTEKGGWTAEHRSDMQVIAFVSEQIKEMAKVKRTKDKEGNDVLLVGFDSPYKDYKDFMKRRYAGGGWYIDKESEVTVGDVKVTAYEIRVDKLSYDGPKRILTWVYHVADVDIAVQFEALENAFPKMEAELRRCLKSFKQIKRSGEALVSDVSTGARELSILEAELLPPEDRKVWRQADERRMHERAQKNLPDGWLSKRFGRFLVVFHTDEKFAKRVADQSEAVWSWLDQTFPFVGEQEYVRSPIIRICKDAAEERQFSKGGDWNYNNLEIVTHQDYGGSESWEMKWVNQRVMAVWFEDKDRDLYWAMPAWLGRGLSDLVGQAYVKSGKMEFRTDHWNRDEVREAAREGRGKRPKELMMLTNGELYGGGSFDGVWNILIQSQALVEFLVTGAASKNPKTKSVLVDYVKSLKAVQLEIKAEEDAKKSEGSDKKKPQTEEEENAYFRALSQGYKDKEARILESTLRRAFAGWAEQDWNQFDDLFNKAIGGK